MSSETRQPDRTLVFSLSTLAIAFFVWFLFMVAISAQAAEQKTQAPEKVPALQPPTAIPVAEVATQAAEVSNLLRTFNRLLCFKILT